MKFSVSHCLAYSSKNGNSFASSSRSRRARRVRREIRALALRSLRALRESLLIFPLILQKQEQADRGDDDDHAADHDVNEVLRQPLPGLLHEEWKQLRQLLPVSQSTQSAQGNQSLGSALSACSARIALNLPPYFAETGAG